MKQCPTCNRTYANDEFAFCLADGTLLSAPYELGEARQLAPANRSSNPPITEVLPTPAPLDDKEAKGVGALVKSTSLRRKWNETEFFQEVSKNPNVQVAESVRKLYELSKEVADKVDFGSGTRTGSFNVKFSHINTRSLYTVLSDGTLVLNFPWLQDTKKSTSVAEKFGRELKPLFGATIPADFLEKYISVRHIQWSQQIDAFMSVVRAVTEA
jgi:hypothetical protein